MMRYDPRANSRGASRHLKRELDRLEKRGAPKKEITPASRAISLPLTMNAERGGPVPLSECRALRLPLAPAGLRTRTAARDATCALLEVPARKEMRWDGREKGLSVTHKRRTNAH